MVIAGPWHSAHAACLPDGSDYDAGSTITCTGIDGNGWPSELPDPDDPDPPSFPLNNLTINVQPGATVSGSAFLGSPITLSLSGAANTVNNNSTISTSGAGAESVGIAGSGARVTNNGAIITSGSASESIGIEGGSAQVINNAIIETTGTGAEGIGIEGGSAQVINNEIIETTGTGAEGIGIEGSGANVSNNDSGLITVNGTDAEGIGIEGSGAQVSNGGSIGMVGDRTQGIAIEGAGATVTNTGGVATDGNQMLGVGIEGTGATVENPGGVTTLGQQSVGIGVFGGNHTIGNAGRVSVGIDSIGIGAIGDGGSMTNSSLVEATGADSAGIIGLGAGKTITNAAGGTIDVNGSDSVGLGLGFVTDLIRDAAALFGVPIPDSSGSVTNDGTITASGIRARGVVGHGDNITVTNNNTIETSGGGPAIEVEGNDNTVTNATTGQITVTGAQARGIVGGDGGSPADDARVVNAGIINVTDDAGGTGARGIEITGDNLKVTNGLGAGSTRLTVSGDDGIGIAVTGAGAEIDNDAPIIMSGDRVRGIDAVAQDGDATYRVVNRETIAVGGDDGAAIVFRTAPGISPAMTDPRERLYINLGAIEVDGERTAGIAFDGISASTADNARTIRTDGTHAGARGIAVAGGNDNFVTNFDSIDLNGTGAVGIDIAGNANTVLNGSGTTTFPNALIDPDPTGIALFPGAPPLVSEISIDDPSRTDVPLGEVLVNGANAVGIRVSGADNRIGIRIQADPASPTGVVPSKVIASGAGAAAVVLDGSGNVLVNDGLLSGQGTGVLGGDGAEMVVNQNAIEGGIRLRGGADELIIADGSSIVGTADGGAGTDTLTMFVPTPAGGFPAPPPLVVNGSGFVNFETVTKIGGGTADLTGVLNAADAGVLQGSLGLTSGSQLLATSTVTVQKSAASSVPSRLEVRAGSLLTAAAVNVGAGASLCNGGVVTGALNINPGATYAAGCSTGTATLAGDLVSAGLLEVEIGGTGAGEFDLFVISGTATFIDAEILFSFFDGFQPGVDDVFEFLSAGDIVGFETVDFLFSGLPDGFDFDVAATTSGLQLVTTGVGAVPEPATIAILLFGLATLGAANWNRAA